MRGAARCRDSRVSAPAGNKRANRRRPRVPGTPEDPGPRPHRALGLSPGCELLCAPAQRRARPGSERARQGGGRFLCHCKCFFFNSSYYELCCECVREGAPALSRPLLEGFPESCSTPLSGGLQLRFCTPPHHRAPQRTTVHTHANTLSLNTFITVRRGGWDLGRSAAPAMTGGLIFIFALRWLTAFI